jgi:hypothetical protein
VFAVSPPVNVLIKPEEQMTVAEDNTTFNDILEYIEV